MAMDIFKEETVVKHHSGLNTAVYYLTWVMIVVFGFLGIMSLYSVLGQIGQGFNWQALLFSAIHRQSAHSSLWRYHLQERSDPTRRISFLLLLTER